ncbi:unknown [Singapore grouper iridovirus]|uniref:Uncharacterized protein n=1 Tax=Singapore grouper iridovirus TaxID=262968 RepID=Q5YFA4_9VIRU|nr:hypothetical protein ORF161R [Singapore grouper iridovirus]AAS18176.1 unknown [Singapore grouper iridovirus]WAU86870.1 hypothetical protein ORF161R [Singapore grouper iridovirus]
MKLCVLLTLLALVISAESKQFNIFSACKARIFNDATIPYDENWGKKDMTAEQYANCLNSISL